MKHYRYICVIALIWAICWIGDSFATSLVYSMRIRRAFSMRTLNAGEQHSTTAISSVPIFSQRKRHIVDAERATNICEDRKIAGDVLNIRYNARKNWWFEATTAFADEWFTAKGSVPNAASRFGFDDIVLAMGYNVLVNDNLQFVYYAIGGLPTSWRPSLDEQFDTLVGTKFFSLGAGSELSYSFINKQDKSVIFLFQNRVIHFFTRSWEPILPRGGKIQPGNVIDLLFSLMYRWTTNLAEIGYNPTFFNNAAVITGTQKIDGVPFVRHGGYVRYTHLFRNFFGEHKPLFLGAGCSMSHSRRFDSQIYALWGVVGVVF